MEEIELAEEVDDPLNVEIVASAAANFVSNVPILVDAKARSVASALSDTFWSNVEIWPACTAEANEPTAPSPMLTNDWAYNQFGYKLIHIDKNI